MHTEDAKPRAEAAFRRRFPAETDIQFLDPQPGYLRVAGSSGVAWVDYDISGWRIRAIAVSDTQPLNGRAT